MCWGRCTALQDNYWPVIQEFDSGVLRLKPEEEIDPDGADKLKVKKQSSLLNAQSLREKQHTFALLLLQCKYKYKVQNALLSIQTEERAGGIVQVLGHYSGSCRSPVS